jgi:hypothetical protein
MGILKLVCKFSNLPRKIWLQKATPSVCLSRMQPLKKTLKSLYQKAESKTFLVILKSREKCEINLGFGEESSPSTFFTEISDE